MKGPGYAMNKIKFNILFLLIFLFTNKVNAEVSIQDYLKLSKSNPEYIRFYVAGLGDAFMASNAQLHSSKWFSKI
jgi:hypothetical protein